MIPYGQYLEIKRLLATTSVSAVKIAERVGVSRASVDNIKREQEPRQRPTKPPKPKRKRGRWRPPKPVLSRDGPLVRCPECGGMTHMPCMVCEVRAFKEEGSER